MNVEDTYIGDIAQLSFNGIHFSHSLLIINKFDDMDLNRILIATHTDDSINRPISTYSYQKIRFIHIEKVRVW